MANQTINGLTQQTTIDPTADFAVFWDTSLAATRKALVGDLTRHWGETTVGSLPTTNVAEGDIAYANNAAAVALNVDLNDGMLMYRGNNGSTDKWYPVSRHRGNATAAVLNALVNVDDGDLAYCTDGRKPSEGGGAGTGVMVYYSSGGPGGAGWYTFGTGALVTT